MTLRRTSLPDFHPPRRGRAKRKASALTEARGVAALQKDATLDCHCGLPSFPVGREAGRVRYECANRHAHLVTPPDDPRLARLVENWLDKRSGQLDEQHRRWEEQS